MVDRRSTRVWWKRVLLLSRVKLIYARITLTKFTTAYFFFAIISCIGIAILQSQTFFSNSEGVLAISQFLAQGNVTTSTVGISFLADGNVFLCQNLPLQTGSNCSILVKHVKSHMRVREIDATFHLGDLAESQTIEERAEPDLHQCAVSLMWLHDVLTDAKREDLTILAYQLWLISMSVVTLLNESLPHLFAGLAARVLGTAWAGFRVQGSINLYSTYLHVVKSGPCRGFDPLNSWWDESEAHEIAGLVSNAVTLLAIAALTFKLFRVYASQSFSRVGTSTEINRVYKLVLVLSVLLQLAGFFTLAQTILWISKISFGSIGKLADHFQIYFAALVVTAVLEVPWLILGWITVRKEQRLRFLVFCFISFGLLLIASLMFASPLYRFVFSAWAFYATITVTSYALIVTTSIVAILCRLQFGKGLKHFLRVTEALDDGDFTPVYFSKNDREDDIKDATELDPEMAILHYSSMKTSEKYHQDPRKPEPIHTRGLSKGDTSIFSAGESPSDTLKLSSTPVQYQNMLSPIVVVEPVLRTSSVKANAAAKYTSPKTRRPPNIHIGPADSFVLPAISVSPMSQRHSRLETSQERTAREQDEPVKRALTGLPASVKTVAMPRRPAPAGLESRRTPSADSKTQGNYF